VKTLNETLDLIAKESADAKFNNHMSGSMIPRGLNFWSISKTLEIVYPEATYDNTLEKFVELEDYHFDRRLEAHFKQFEKENA